MLTDKQRAALQSFIALDRFTEKCNESFLLNQDREHLAIAYRMAEARAEAMLVAAQERVPNFSRYKARLELIRARFNQRRFVQGGSNVDQNDLW